MIGTHLNVCHGNGHKVATCSQRFFQVMEGKTNLILQGCVDAFELCRGSKEKTMQIQHRYDSNNSFLFGSKPCKSDTFSNGTKDPKYFSSTFW